MGGEKFIKPQIHHGKLERKPVLNPGISGQSEHHYHKRNGEGQIDGGFKQCPSPDPKPLIGRRLKFFPHDPGHHSGSIKQPQQQSVSFGQGKRISLEMVDHKKRETDQDKIHPDQPELCQLHHRPFRHFVLTTSLSRRQPLKPNTKHPIPTPIKFPMTSFTFHARWGNQYCTPFES